MGCMCEGLPYSDSATCHQQLFHSRGCFKNYMKTILSICYTTLKKKNPVFSSVYDKQNLQGAMNDSKTGFQYDKDKL